jgi:hypothetical protein
MKVHPVTIGLDVIVAVMMAVTLGSIVGHKIAPERIAQSRSDVESTTIAFVRPITAIAIVRPIPAVALVQPIRVIVASPYKN